MATANAVDSDKMLDGPMKLSARQQRRRRLQQVHGYAWTGAAAVAAAASAAMLSGDIEGSSDRLAANLDSHLEPGSSVHCSLPGLRQLIAGLCDAAKAMLELIGRPPRLPLSEPEPPATLLWAADLCIICVTASAILFILAMTAGADPDEPEEPLEELQDSVSKGSIVEDFSAGLLTRLRVIAVIVLSATSGGFLNVKHVLKSTLFLGF